MSDEPSDSLGIRAGMLVLVVLFGSMAVATVISPPVGDDPGAADVTANMTATEDVPTSTTPNDGLTTVVQTITPTPTQTTITPQDNVVDATISVEADVLNPSLMYRGGQIERASGSIVRGHVEWSTTSEPEKILVGVSAGNGNVTNILRMDEVSANGSSSERDVEFGRYVYLEGGDFDRSADRTTMVVVVAVGLVVDGDVVAVDTIRKRFVVDHRTRTHLDISTEEAQPVSSVSGNGTVIVVGENEESGIDE